MKMMVLILSMLTLRIFVLSVSGQSIAYIYGGVAPDGSIPSGTAKPFHQMRLEDTGKLGLSQFKAMVESEGYTIKEHCE